MASSPSFDLVDQSDLRPKQSNPYLRVHAVKVYVRDQDRSMRFYLDQLGFTLAFDVAVQSGQRWVVVSPPNGTAVLTLIAPDPNSDEYKLIGQPTSVIFVTEDVVATYSEWRRRGVRFGHTPRLRRGETQQPAPGGSSRGAVMLFGKKTPIRGGGFKPLVDNERKFFSLVSFFEMTQKGEG